MQKKQQWYQANQVNMSREDEQEYLEYCAEAMFRIHILELRLNRFVFFLFFLDLSLFKLGSKTLFLIFSHKEKAPILYQEMEQKLRADPRLGLAK